MKARKNARPAPRSRPKKRARPNSAARPAPRKVANDAGERLQKVLAAAGVASRRECEELISAGRVEVDRQVVTELGARVDPQRQEIRLDGELLRKMKPIHYLVHKPVGVVSTHRDPARRTRVIDLVGGDERLFTVGRLDLDSSGLILVTNDGDLANRLAHPRYEVPKTYRVMVAGQPSLEVIAELRKGVHLAEGKVQPRQVVIRRLGERSTLLEMVLTEGRNREIRRMMARVGHKVLQLTRIAFGPLRLGDLPSGAFRPLTHEEVNALRVRPTLVRPLRATPHAARGARKATSSDAATSRRARKEASNEAAPRQAGGGAGEGKAKAGRSGRQGSVIGGAAPRPAIKKGTRRSAASNASGPRSKPSRPGGKARRPTSR